MHNLNSKLLLNSLKFKETTASTLFFMLMDSWIYDWAWAGNPAHERIVRFWATQANPRPKAKIYIYIYTHVTWQGSCGRNKVQVWLKNRVVLNHVFGWIIGHKTYNPIEAVVLLLWRFELDTCWLRSQPLLSHWFLLIRQGGDGVSKIKRLHGVCRPNFNIYLGFIEFMQA